MGISIEIQETNALKIKADVLVLKHAQELKFDVKGQKCIIYSGIRELEEKLSKELPGLR